MYASLVYDIWDMYDIWDKPRRRVAGGRGGGECSVLSTARMTAARQASVARHGAGRGESTYINLIILH